MTVQDVADHLELNPKTVKVILPPNISPHLVRDFL
jgi:hypothetical protein